MAEDTRDTLMAIMVSNQWIPAESQSFVDVKNDLLVNAGEFAPGTFCAIDEFEIELSAQDDGEDDDPEAAKEAVEKNAKEMSKKIENLQRDIAALSAGGKGGKPDSKLTGGSKQQFSRFLNKAGGSGIKGRHAYPVEMEPISVTRKMDAGSIQLFDSCQNIMILDKAIILKRRALGADALQTYMRIDFTNLLITDLDWQEDDVIKETFKFICREVKIQYRAERRDQKEGVGGTNDHMGKPIGPYGWKVLDLERKG